MHTAGVGVERASGAAKKTDKQKNIATASWYKLVEKLKGSNSNVKISRLATQMLQFKPLHTEVGYLHALSSALATYATYANASDSDTDVNQKKQHSETSSWPGIWPAGSAKTQSTSTGFDGRTTSNSDSSAGLALLERLGCAECVLPSPRLTHAEWVAAKTLLSTITDEETQVTTEGIDAYMRTCGLSFPCMQRTAVRAYPAKTDPSTKSAYRNVTESELVADVLDLELEVDLETQFMNTALHRSAQNSPVSAGFNGEAEADRPANQTAKVDKWSTLDNRLNISLDDWADKSFEGCQSGGSSASVVWTDRAMQLRVDAGIQFYMSKNRREYW